MSFYRPLRIGLAALSMLVCGFASDDAEAIEGFWEEITYADAALAGPEKAKGVVVYSHGTGTDESYHHPPPPWLRLLQRDGWDMVSFKRKLAYDRVWEAEEALAGEVANLKQRGYRHIVLAGQSRGAWLSLVMAARSRDVFAAIATAPGGYGDSFAGTAQSAGELSGRLKDVKNARVMIFLFEGDRREQQIWGGRGRMFEDALSNATGAHLVVDRPAEFIGHTAAGSGRFARAYGECIRNFIDPAPVPAEYGCSLDRGLAAGEDVPLPTDLTVPAGRADFVGRWVSFYESGDARVLALTEMEAGKSKGVFAWAPSPGAEKVGKAGWERIECDIGGEVLSCPRKEGTGFFRQANSTTLEYEWVPKGEGRRIKATFRRH
ncbi:MAG: alpha/beta hydrolase [Magnetospirillum sp.]|nr:alpha/beta hydrolase [Magnetospirillum sp.]